MRGKVSGAILAGVALMLVGVNVPLVAADPDLPELPISDTYVVRFDGEVPWHWVVTGIGQPSEVHDFGALTVTIVYGAQTQKWDWSFNGLNGSGNCNGIDQETLGGTLQVHSPLSVVASPPVPCQEGSAGIDALLRPEPIGSCEGSASGMGTVGSITVSGGGAGPGLCVGIDQP